MPLGTFGNVWDILGCHNTGEGGGNRQHWCLVGGGQGALACNNDPAQISVVLRLRNPALSELGAILCLVTKLGDILLDTGGEASSHRLPVLGHLLSRRAVGVKAWTAILAKRELK